MVVDRWPPLGAGAELPLDPFLLPLPVDPPLSGADPFSSGADPPPPGAEPLPPEAPGSELVVVVVALAFAGAEPLAGGEPLPGAFDSFARAGEIATRPTMPAANGTRNLRCMAASLHLCNVC
jgi:hypothetical protein